MSQDLPPSTMDLLARLAREVASGQLRVAPCKRKDGNGAELVIVADDPTTQRTYPLAVLVSDTIFCDLEPPGDMVPGVDIDEGTFDLGIGASNKDDKGSN